MSYYASFTVMIYINRYCKYRNPPAHARRGLISAQCLRNRRSAIDSASRTSHEGERLHYEGVVSGVFVI